MTAPHSSTLAWKIPWMEEPGRLQCMGSLEVGHDWVTSLSLFTFMHWRRTWQPTPVFLPGKSQGRGHLVGCRLCVAQSWTWLKRLSSSSSNTYMKLLSRVQLFVTPWTVAYQAPQSMGFSRQEYWSGLPFQGIFPTQGSNLGLPHCRQMLYRLSYQGSPTLIWDLLYAWHCFSCFYMYWII